MLSEHLHYNSRTLMSGLEEFIKAQSFHTFYNSLTF